MCELRFSKIDVTASCARFNLPADRLTDNRRANAPVYERLTEAGTFHEWAVILAKRGTASVFVIVAIVLVSVVRRRDIED
jgi:hypothetical protein